MLSLNLWTSKISHHCVYGLRKYFMIEYMDLENISLLSVCTWNSFMIDFVDLEIF